jgi:hypothetical protein
MLLKIVPTGKIEMVKVKIDAKFACRRVHDAQAFGHDFLADSVPWNHGNAVLRHGFTFNRNESMLGQQGLLDRRAY